VRYDDGTLERMDLFRKTIRWPDEEEEEEEDDEEEQSDEEHRHHHQQQQMQEEEEEGKEEEKQQQQQQEHPGHALVNKRIQIKWPGDGTFYSGVVTKYFPKSGKHEVTYDASDTLEVLDLANTEIRWVDEAEEEEEGVGEDHQCQQQQQQQQQETPDRGAAVSLADALGQGRDLPAMVLEHHMLPFLNDRDRFILARASKALHAAVSNPAAWTRRLDVTCSSGYTCKDQVTQSGRRSRPRVANDMTEGLCRYLALPQFSQMEALYLKVKIYDASLLSATLYESFPHLKTLALDGRGVFVYHLREWGWSVPAIFDMIRRLENLQELQFPLTTSKSKSLFSHIPHVHTLHLVNKEHLDEADLNLLLPKTPHPNIRVLTIIAFQKLDHSTMRRLLLSFPLLKMLSLRFTYFADDIEQLKERILADQAFVGREEGWLDKIVFDLDNEVVLRTPQQNGWLRDDLFAFDDLTGEIKKSLADLVKTYKRHYLFCD
jgi:hypothetical protein